MLSQSLFVCLHVRVNARVSVCVRVCMRAYICCFRCNSAFSNFCSLHLRKTPSNLKNSRECRFKLTIYTTHYTCMHACYTTRSSIHICSHTHTYTYTHVCTRSTHWLHTDIQTTHCIHNIVLYTTTAFLTVLSSPYL